MRAEHPIGTTAVPPYLASRSIPKGGSGGKRTGGWSRSVAGGAASEVIRISPIPCEW